MAYIGESSDLAKRIVGTWSRLNRRLPSGFGPDERAVRRLAQLQKPRDFEFEISWYPANQQLGHGRLSDSQWRKGLEAYHLWKVRRETGVSAIANHGRATLQASDQLGAPEFGAGYPARIRASSTPLHEPTNEPYSVTWMGPRWTPTVRPEDLKGGRNWEAVEKELRESGKDVPVLWKALAPSTRELLKVGFTTRGSDGVLAAARNMRGQPLLSWVPRPRPIAQEEYIWRELRNDLIGGYFQQTGEPPAQQFSSPPKRSFPIKGYQLRLSRETDNFYSS